MSKSSRPRARKPAAAAPAPVKRPREPDRLVLGLAGLGLLITAYLTAVALWGTAPALCAEGSGCDLVQGSRWSRFLGLPVAFWGLGLYALVALTAGLMPAQLKRWRRLLWLGAVGLGVSLYLTVVAAIELQTWCLWCMVSLACIAAIVVVLLLRRPGNAPGIPLRLFAVQIGFAVIAVVGAMGLAHSEWLQPPEDPRLRALAEHLERSGAKYYGAFWCANCEQQRRLFGAAAKRLPYVECSPNGRSGAVAFACVGAEIRAYPTWIIKDRRYEEVIEPERLARLSGFAWEARAAR
jgi:uncharacterized membrane protein